MTAHSLAEAWDIECQSRGANRNHPGYEDARALFYTGATAMLAMMTAVGPDRHALLGFYADMKAELEQYLAEQDEP